MLRPSQNFTNTTNLSSTVYGGNSLFSNRPGVKYTTPQGNLTAYQGNRPLRHTKGSSIKKVQAQPDFSLDHAYNQLSAYWEQAKDTFWQWVSPQYATAKKMAASDKRRALFHKSSMDRLESNLQTCNTHRALAQHVTDFYNKLAPFQQIQKEEISAEVFNLLIKHQTAEAVSYVIHTVDVPELGLQLRKQDIGYAIEGMSPAFSEDSSAQIFIGLSGTRTIMAYDDLEQLERAVATRYKFNSHSANWPIDISQEEIDRIAYVSKDAWLCNTVINQQRKCKDLTAYRRLRLLAQIYPPRLVEAIGGYDVLLNMPVISLPEYYGDYIDFINPAEMDTPVKRGIDNFGRPVIVFCYHQTGGEFVVEALFQRFIDEKENWTSGSRQNARALRSQGWLEGLVEEPKISEHLYADDIKFISQLFKGAAKKRRWVKEKNDEKTVVRHLENPEGDTIHLCPKSP